MDKDKKIFRDEVTAQDREGKTGDGSGGRNHAPGEMLVEFSKLWQGHTSENRAMTVAKVNGLAKPTHVRDTTHLFIVPAGEEEFWPGLFRALSFVLSAVRAPARHSKK